MKDKVLVFGSKGMFGSYLTNILDKKGYDVVKSALEKNEGEDIHVVDVTDGKSVESLIKNVEPDWVINCAAYTNVNKAESESDIANVVNALAPKYMAKVCKDMNIPLVHISTDQVFGDNRKEGYEESCTDFKPLNVYGSTKLDGEKNILESGCTSYIFRTSWLFGPNATNFIKFVTDTALDKEKEIKIVTDEIGCPTYVGDLTKRVEMALDGEIEPGIYHACSKNALSRYEFAKEILDVQDIEREIEPIDSSMFTRPAKVPSISILVNTKLPEARSSYEMLEEYVKEVKNEKDCYTEKLS